MDKPFVYWSLLFASILVKVFLTGMVRVVEVSSFPYG